MAMQCAHGEIKQENHAAKEKSLSGISRAQYELLGFINPKKVFDIQELHGV